MHLFFGLRASFFIIWQQLKMLNSPSFVSLFLDCSIFHELKPSWDRTIRISFQAMQRCFFFLKMGSKTGAEWIPKWDTWDRKWPLFISSSGPLFTTRIWDFLILHSCKVKETKPQNTWHQSWRLEKKATWLDTKKFEKKLHKCIHGNTCTQKRETCPPPFCIWLRLENISTAKV